MKVTMITFSPTGGTLKCAEVLVNAIGTMNESVDLTQRNLKSSKLDSENIAVIAVPSFSGRVPALAAERLMSIDGNGAKAVVMVVYGNRAYEDTMIELADIAKSRGFNVVAGVSAVARHSIVNKIALDRPDAQDRDCLITLGKSIAAKLRSKDYTLPPIPGNHPCRKAGKGMVPKTNNHCNGCDKCANLCPSGAIDFKNPHNIDKNLCINCMRCVEICPHGAKYLPTLMAWLVGKMLKKPCESRKEPELFI